jgi:hypothetical protein
MKVLAEKRKEVIMNAIDHRQGIEKKIGVWKAKMHGLIRKVERLGYKKGKKILNIQDLNMNISEMSSRIEHFNNERPTEWASRMKNTDYGFVDVRDKYVLRTRPSFTGLYGKEPWPRERKMWEKV